MQGIRDSAYLKQEHSYFVYEVLKCQDSLRARTDEIRDPFCLDNPILGRKCERKLTQLDPNCKASQHEHCESLDPQCAPLHEINHWIS